MSISRTCSLLVIALILTPCHVLYAQFAEGNFFSTSANSKGIEVFDSSGSYLRTMSPAIGSDEIIRGAEFGPDGLLYSIVPSHSGPARVVALDSSGLIQQSYDFSPFTGSNSSYGKMTFGNNGMFYVASGLGLVKFELGNASSGHLISDRNIFDVTSLPNGNLLAVEAYGMRELDTAGNLVRTINISDPLDLNGGNVGFVDLRGVAYDPTEDMIYATQLGYSGFTFRLMKLEADTGILLNHEEFWYGDEISLNADGTLAVASRTQDPGLFDKDLTYLGSFDGGTGRHFITQYSPVAVPEPQMMGVLAVGSILLASWGLVKRRRSNN